MIYSVTMATVRLVTVAMETSVVQFAWLQNVVFFFSPSFSFEVSANFVAKLFEPSNC